MSLTPTIHVEFADGTTRDMPARDGHDAWHDLDVVAFDLWHTYPTGDAVLVNRGPHGYTIDPADEAHPFVVELGGHPVTFTAPTADGHHLATLVVAETKRS